MGSEPSLIDYINAFHEFDIEINKNHSIPSQDVNYEGYLVNYERYQNFKILVNNLYNNQQNQFHSPINVNPTGSTNYNDILEQNRLTTESLPLVESQIVNGNSFIIINKKLFKLICKKTETQNNKIEYKIIAGNPGFIQFNLNNNQKIIQFKNNKKNIIDKSTVLGIKENEDMNNNNNKNNEQTKNNTMIKDNWLIIYRDVINYFNFENSISINLNNNKSEPIQFRGFLVNNDWVDNWKKNSFYEEIKANIILKNIKDDNFINNFITTKQLETKSYYDGILDIKNYIISDNQIEEALKTDKSYTLLSENFVSQFMNNSNQYLITFVLSYQKITIKLLGKSFPFPANNNVIKKANNNNGLQDQININNIEQKNSYNSEYLKHLIRYTFFKSELKSPISLTKQKIYKAYLVKNEILNELKKIYNLKGLVDTLKNNNILNGINYKICDSYYSKISKFLNEKTIQYISEIKQIEQTGKIKFNGPYNSFSTRYLNGLPKLIFIEDFDIIDEEFATFLQKIFNNIGFFEVNFGILEDKIFLIIFNKTTNIYEIVSFNQEDDFVVEYLIEILNHGNFLDKNTLNNFIFQYITKNRLQNLISSNNYHPVTNNLYIKFYPVKVDMGKIQQIPQLNLVNKDNNQEVNNNNKNQLIQSPEQQKILSQNQNLEIGEVSRMRLFQSYNPEYQLSSFQTPNGFNNNLPRQNSFGINLDNNTYTNNERISSQDNINSVNIFTNHQNALNQQYQTVLLNKNENQRLLNNPPSQTHIVNKKEDETNLINNIRFSMNIIRERENLLDQINKPKGNKNNPNKEYYLIHESYINKLSSLFHLVDIRNIMGQYSQKKNEELFNIVKEAAKKDKELKKLNLLDKATIQSNMDSIGVGEFHHYYANNDKSTNLLYYKHCDIISFEILNLLREIDKNINRKIQKVKCVFDCNKIMLFINDKIINIANYNKGINTEYIIISNGQNNSCNLSQIFKKFEDEGQTNFINKFCFSNLINFNINYYNQITNVSANIYKITPDGKIEYIPSDKLKVMILLSLYQKYNFENIPQKVYLIDPQWLKQYEYEKIKKLVDADLNKINNFGKLSYDLNFASQIIPFLSIDKLKKYDQEYYSKAPNPNLHFNCRNYEQIIKDLQIFFCKKFVLINEELYKLFNHCYKISLPNMDIIHIKKTMDGDIIIIKNYPINSGQIQINMQNLIFSGIIDLNQNRFNIQHIFEYKDKPIFDKEIEMFLKDNISNYISRKTFLNQKNNNEYFSPIFENNQIIGNYYKFKEGFDYKKCFNYYKYFNNKQLLNLVYLYCNELSLKNKIRKPNYKDESFCVIKRKILTDMKEENNFDKLKDYLVGKIVNIPPSIKEIYQVIKTFPQKDLPYLRNDIKQIYITNDQLPAYEIEAEMITNPNNKNESFMIYRDFELIDSTIKNKFIDDKIPFQSLRCNFVPDNRILIYYPINKFNKNSMCVVSKIDENNNFLNEYLLISKIENYFAKYLEKIKFNLDNFLRSLAFVKNVAPMITSNYIEVGFVIKLIGPPPQPDIPLVITDITKDFLRKPLIGFENIGATCYMNATLQCLCNIKTFAEFFKYSKHLKKIVKDDINQEKLCSAFKILLDDCYPIELSQNYQIYLSQNPNKPKYAGRDLSKKSYAPENFKETISRMNPLFEGVAANDAKDLVNFLIMTLHEETNTVHPSPIDNNPGNMSMDQTNQVAMFNKFFQNFAQNYRSVISDLFYALNCNITQCGNCQKISYNYQIYFFLIFPLEEVKKYKLQNNNIQFMNYNFNNFNNNMVNNIVDIYDCFAYEQKINFMCGENAMYCNYCRQTCGSSMRTILTTGPKILIIILNRGKGNEFNVKINFYPEINLTNYMERKDLVWKYELFGVITHIGESGMGGHFIAYCKEFWTNQWLKYNDAIVSPVSDFKREVIDFAMPYLLFYQIKEK